MNSLAYNVRRSIPQGNKTREEYVAAHIEHINTDVYIIDYSGDQNLPYNIPLTLGEWLISHGYLEDSLKYIGGQRLVDRVGGMGWLLLLLLEIVPNSFEISNVETYRDIFSKSDEELKQYIDMKIDEADYLDYTIWICYIALSGCTLGINNDLEFTNTIHGLGALTPEMQMSLYSMLISLTKPIIEDFESDFFIEIFTVAKFDNFCNMIKQEQTIKDIVEKRGIDFGILGNNNPSSVLLAKWFDEDYGLVDFNKKIEDVDVTKFAELSTLSDVEILKVYYINKLYIGRSDLLYIVRDAINLGFPVILRDDELNTSKLVYKRGLLHASADENTYTISKYYDEQMEETTYSLDDVNNEKENEIVTIISSIVDYKNIENSYYDRLRNAEIYYVDREELRENIAYLYLAYAVQKGQYGGSYGLPYTRVESYLYSIIVGNFKDDLFHGKYYTIPIGIIENRFLMQDKNTIKKRIKDFIEFQDIINTCRLYDIDFQSVIQSTKEIWNKNYAENYGIIKPEPGNVIDEIYFSYKNSSNYIEYLKRLSIILHHTNEVYEGDGQDNRKISMFKEEEEEEEEEGSDSDNDYMGVY